MKLTRQYAGSEGSSTFQTTTMTYDGHGRLKTRHVPEQDTGTATTWDYNLDDTIQKVTDARGSISNFSYNARHLPIGMTYDPSTGITDTPDVSLSYDAAGNRTAMADGSGSVSYQYNQLSQVTSETRQFSSGPTGSYTLSYDYNLAGSPKSITDPSGATINYTFDSIGRTTVVTGSSFGGDTTTLRRSFSRLP